MKPNRWAWVVVLFVAVAALSQTRLPQTYVDGTLTVSDSVNFLKDETFNVGSAASSSSDLVAWDGFTSKTNAIMGGTLTSTGAVSALSTLDVAGAAILGSSLTVTNAIKGESTLWTVGNLSAGTLVGGIGIIAYPATATLEIDSGTDTAIWPIINLTNSALLDDSYQIYVNDDLFVVSNTTAAAESLRLSATLATAPAFSGVGSALTAVDAATIDGTNISVGTWADNQILKYDAATGVLTNEADAGGAEVNDLEGTAPAAILTTEILIGTGAGTAAFAAMSGDATMANDGTVTVVDDLHAHVIGNIDSMTSAALALQVSNETGTGALVFQTSPTIGGTLAGASATLSGTLDVTGATTLDDVTVGGTLTATQSTMNVSNVTAQVLSTTGDADILGNIELGHATDTTLARSAAGVVQIQGKTIHMLAGDDIPDTDIVDALTITGGTIDKTTTHAIYTQIITGNHTAEVSECYGGVFYITGAHILTLPDVADGMHVTTIGTAASVATVDANAATDYIRLDGTLLAGGDSVDSSGAAGDVAVFTYYNTTSWYATTDGWVDGDP